MKILLLEDETIQRITVRDDLLDAGHSVADFESPKEALKVLKKQTFDAILSDLKMPGMDGIEFLTEVKKISSSTEVIIMTAFATVGSAVEAMRQGAYDYITKPFELEELLQRLARIEKMLNLSKENIQLRQQLKVRHSFERLVGKSNSMKKLIDYLEIISPTNSTVLITGETGTGKELVAEAIHYHSLNAKKPFIKISCAILSRDILESELFGHEKGAFTGALRQKIGRFELAKDGSIFLDDVDDIPLDLQVKLLRVLQEREFERVGGTTIIPFKARVIISTKKNLYELVKKGKFREDLYYRLNIVPVYLHPLRDRKEDIPVLIDYFLKTINPNYIPKLDKKTVSILLDYPWEGNIRELKNLVERLSVVCKCNPIIPKCLPSEILENRHSSLPLPNTPENFSTLPETLAQYEIETISHAISAFYGNKEKAAKKLGIPVSTLKSKIKKYRIK